MAAEVHCQRLPAGTQSLANYLHNASRWLVIAMATAGVNITIRVDVTDDYIRVNSI